MDVFNLLHNETHRKARHVVYKYHRDILDGNAGSKKRLIRRWRR